MTEHSVIHGIFTLERTYDASPARVFAAFATEEGKSRWFSGGNEAWDQVERAFDFRVGGQEVLEGKWKLSGMTSRFEATYFDIVENERIIYAYEMIIDGTKISTSLASIETKPNGTGTRLVVTEQGAFLDGYDDNGSREKGTASLLERLRESLK
jgi:uncharacterized protein YndB with AHSA1/START domain